MPRITPISPERLIRIFERDGFKIARRRGDHVMMTKPGVKRPVVIVVGQGEVPVAHIRTNLTTAGMSRERYFDLLRQR